MTIRLLWLLSAVFVCSILYSPANCADSTAQDQPQLYTNEDIAKYQTPSDTVTASEQPASEEDGKVSRKDKKQYTNKDKKQQTEEHEMEYWCGKAKTCNQKIEDGREAIKEIENEIFEAKTKGRSNHEKLAALEKKLATAKKRLRKAEKDLTDLENEAHRKGAKPGWLRCQI
jgi:chromosome segregation ATPase